MADSNYRAGHVGPPVQRHAAPTQIPTMRLSTSAVQGHGIDEPEALAEALRRSRGLSPRLSAVERRDGGPGWKRPRSEIRTTLIDFSPRSSATTEPRNSQSQKSKVWHCWEHRTKNGAWHPFPVDISAAVEESYREGNSFIVVDINGRPYHLDFDSMLQCSIDDSSRTRKVRRIPLNQGFPICMSTSAKWEFKCSSYWKAYDEEHNALIEEAWREATPIVSISVCGREYLIDFNSMRQICTDDPSKSRVVRRNSLVNDKSEDGLLLRSAILGKRVRRGPDWSWGDRDGGPKNVGITCEDLGMPPQEGWVSVSWPNGHVHQCRVGHDTKHDLVIVSGGRDLDDPPIYWLSCSDRVNLIRCADLVKKKVQDLFDATYSPTVTRDRAHRAKQDHVPQKYTALDVRRVQNVELWDKYVAKIREMQMCFKSQQISATWTWPEIWTNCVHLEADRLGSDFNEFYLFHGAPSQAVQGIVHNGLDIRKANDGLFGPLAYLAESITKADEYSPNADEVHEMLICRVALGQVLFTSADKPDKTFIAKELLDTKRFHSVLGQRLHSGYREFAVADTALIYPEYLVSYQRF